MIRRSPTRIELKLEDMQEIEFVQKADRRKAILAACTGIEEAKKLIRQERIGYQGSGGTSRASGTAGSRRISSQQTTTTTPASQARTSTASQATVSTSTPSQVENVVGSDDVDLIDMSTDSPATN